MHIHGGFCIFINAELSELKMCNMCLYKIGRNKFIAYVVCLSFVISQSSA
nr:MAG TPA: hypothetical protein [Caudoviricetes sp.]